MIGRRDGVMIPRRGEPGRIARRVSSDHRLAIAWRRPSLLVRLCLVLATASPALARAAAEHPPDWSPELGPALEALEAGRLERATALCQMARQGARDPRVRLDADALAAMVLLRSADRRDVAAGQARMLTLAREAPALLERPEVLLASGQAHLTLRESTAALVQITQAARDFASRGDGPHLARANVALADAWTAHTEWELTPRSLTARLPQNAQEAYRLRLERITALRDETQRLGVDDVAVARIELLLGRLLQERAPTRGAGLDLLAQVADAHAGESVGAEAAWSLAVAHDQDGRWDLARERYRQAAAAPDAELSRRAAQALDDIIRPRVMVSLEPQRDAGVPPWGAPALPGAEAGAEADGLASALPTILDPGGPPRRVTVRSRNVGRVRVELRRVDLPTWLESRQGRLSTAALPTDGSVVFTYAVEPAGDASHAWATDERGAPAALDRGAYVLVARDESASSPAVEKRLVLVSALRATMLSSARRAALLLTSSAPTGEQSDLSAAQARFWMYGSYVPLRVTVPDGAVTFPVPPEANVLRDRRWTCLVAAEDDLALCAGQLPSSEERAAHGLRSLVLGAGPEPAPGDELTIVGWLPGTSFLDEVPAQPLRLDVLDAMDRRRESIPLELGVAGTFRASWQVAEERAGQLVALVVRRGDQVVEGLRGRAVLRVEGRDTTLLDVRVTVPAWTPANAPPPGVQVQATYPWGLPAADAVGSCLFRAVRLPDEQRGADACPNVRQRLRLNEHGRARILTPLDQLVLPPGPAVYGVAASVTGVDGRTAMAEGRSLRHAESEYAWLSRDGRGGMGGERISVGFFSAGRDVPALRLRLRGLDGNVTEHAELWDGPGGLRASEPPEGAPPAEATVLRTTGDGESRVLARHVDGAEALDAATRLGRCAAVRHDGGVRVELTGGSQRALLLVLHAGEPRAARRVAPFDDGCAADLDVAGPLPSDACVLVFREDESGGVHLLRRVAVQPDAPDALTLQVEATLSALPGAPLPVDIRLQDGLGRPVAGAVLLRVAEVEASPGFTWRGDPPRDDTLPFGERLGLRVSGALSAASANGEQGGLGRDAALPPDLHAAMAEGGSRWVELHPLEGGAAHIAVPMPPQARRYNLYVVAFTEDAPPTVKKLVLDTRSGLELEANLPRLLVGGDHVAGALKLRGPFDRPVQARVAPPRATGLAPGRLRAARPADPVRIDDQGEAVIDLAPGQTVTLLAPLEAVDAGPASIVFQVASEAGMQSASARCEVRPAQDTHARGAAPRIPASQPVTLAVTRTLMLLEQEPAPPQPAPSAWTDVRTSPNWLRRALPADARLTAGQRIVVREQLEAPIPLEWVTWRQTMPATCFTYAPPVSGLREIGGVERLARDEIQWRSERLPAGPHIHEYVIVTGRPGSCALPLPHVTAGAAGEIPVRMIADPIDVEVSEGP
jgi:hypothetical protein